METIWDTAQDWEREWWGDCTNTLGEEIKQLTYAKYMGLEIIATNKSPYNIKADGLSILDIGGGPVSLLLKSLGASKMCVADPQKLPVWVFQRYVQKGIFYINAPGEALKQSGILNVQFDEVWIYNVLQHTIEPKRVIENALKFGRLVRIFEWLDTHINIGHPHSLSDDKLDEWLGGVGRVRHLAGEGGCWGKCYYGVFHGI